MTAPNKIRVGLVLLAVLGGVIWEFLRGRIPDPIYQDKRLSYWVARYGTEWEKPNAAVRQAGTNAFPLLLQLMRTQDSPLKRKLIQLGQMQHSVKWPFVSQERRHYYRALCGFEALGTNGQGAVPALLQICELKTPRPSQDYALNALEAIGTAPKESIASLESAATNDIPELRKYALKTLGRMRAEPETTVPLLLECLKDPDTEIQAAAAESLGDLGPRAQNALPQLLELRKNVPVAVHVPDGQYLSREMLDDILHKIDPAAAAGIHVTNASPASAQ